MAYSNQNKWKKREERFHVEGHIVYLIMFVIFYMTAFFGISFLSWMLSPSTYITAFLTQGIFVTVFAIIWLTLFKWNIFNLRSKKDKFLDARSEKEKFFKECEGTINYYLFINKGNAFSAKALKSKLEEVIENPNLKEYFRRDINNILNNMVNQGTANSVQKNGHTHYFL